MAFAAAAVAEFYHLIVDHHFTYPKTKRIRAGLRRSSRCATM
jgi:hypothetical protein